MIMEKTNFNQIQINNIIFNIEKVISKKKSENKLFNGIFANEIKNIYLLMEVFNKSEYATDKGKITLQLQIDNLIKEITNGLKEKTKINGENKNNDNNNDNNDNNNVILNQLNDISLGKISFDQNIINEISNKAQEEAKIKKVKFDIDNEEENLTNDSYNDDEEEEYCNCNSGTSYCVSCGGKRYFKGEGRDEHLKEKDTKKEKFLNFPIKDLGITKNESISRAIIQSNTPLSNLVSNIAYVNYLKGNKHEPEKLLKVESLPSFRDDIYCFGYYPSSQAAKFKGEIVFDLSKNNGGSAELIITDISTAFKKAFNNDQKIIDTIGTIKITKTPTINTNGLIKETITEIEHKTNNKILNKFYELYPNEKEVGYVIMKIDISEMGVNIFEQHKNKLENCLFNIGYGFYSLDVTRDYARICEIDQGRKHLLNYKNFITEEKLEEEILKRIKQEQKLHGKQAIKNNSFERNNKIREKVKNEGLFVLLDKEKTRKTAGNNIIKYYYYLDNRRINVRWYNKFTSNLESKGVFDTDGTQLSEIAYCNKTHMRETFNNKEIFKLGIFRCEITINGYCKDDGYNLEDNLEDEYKRFGDYEMFYDQPLNDQWSALQEKVKKNLVLCNRKTGVIDVCWYASSLTGKWGGNQSKIVHLMKNLNKDLSTVETYAEKEKIYMLAEKEWNNTILYYVSNYGWKVPIIVLDYDVSEDNKNIIIYKPRIFIKEGPTILAPFNFPYTIYDENIRKYYPPYFMFPDDHDNVEFIWRPENMAVKNGAARAKIHDLFKCIEIKNNKKIINNIVINHTSKRERTRINKKIKDETIAEELKEELIKEIKKQAEEAVKNEEAEKLIKEEKDKNKRAEQRRQEINNDFKASIEEDKFKVPELKRVKIIDVYGYKKYENNKVILAYFTNEKKNKKSLCYANYKLTQELNKLENLFEKYDGDFNKNKNKEPVFLLPYNTLKIDCNDGRNLTIHNKEEFIKDYNETYSTYININDETNNNNNESAKKYLEKMIYKRNGNNSLKDMEGNKTFLVLGWGESTGAKIKTYNLFVKEKDKEEEPYFIKGLFLNDEIKNLINDYKDLTTIELPLYLCVGENRRHPIQKNNCKDVKFYTKDELLKEDKKE